MSAFVCRSMWGGGGLINPVCSPRYWWRLLTSGASVWRVRMHTHVWRRLLLSHSFVGAIPNTKDVSAKGGHVSGPSVFCFFVFLNHTCSKFIKAQDGRSKQEGKLFQSMTGPTRKGLQHKTGNKETIKLRITQEIKTRINNLHVLTDSVSHPL